MKILDDREKRVAHIEKLLLNNVTVISLRCNYPGRDKNNADTLKVINIINEVVNKRLEILKQKYFTSSEGPIYLYTVKEKPENVKNIMIDIEDNHFLGRLVDLDVYYNSIKSFSRKDFQKPPRSCFVCDKEAFDCIINKRHTLLELTNYFHKQVELFEKLPLEIIEYTNQAMLYELFITPSFGLVTPYSKGAHLDMDHFTFIDSISVLNRYMYEFACLAKENLSWDKLYTKAIDIGKNCEVAMFNKTKGINTHKGLIFILGTIIISVMKTIIDGYDFDNIFTYCKKLALPKLKELNNLHQDNLSNGEKVYLKYQIAGVRKEASLGFPIIQEALKLLDVDDKTTYIKTLIYIMSVCDDTTIINRKGIEGLNYVKKIMLELREKGYDELKLSEVSQKFIEKGISPGGAADLLCGTIFLSLIKNNIFRRRVK